MGSLKREADRIDAACRALDARLPESRVVVTATRIIGTDHVVFGAHEPTSGVMGPHSSISTIGGRWYGRVGTRRPPPELEALPGYEPRVPGSGRERQERVSAWYEQQYEIAYEAILREWPEVGTYLGTGKARKTMGEIDVWSRQLADRVEPRPAWRSGT